MTCRAISVRGKYRDVILPMTVIRRLDALLEPGKQAVLAMQRQLDAAGVLKEALNESILASSEHAR